MHDSIDDHIRAIAHRRGPKDAADLREALQRACWPGGTHDRAEPAASAWLRRWRPTPGASGACDGAQLVCGCRAGSCVICN